MDESIYTKLETQEKSKEILLEILWVHRPTVNYQKQKIIVRYFNSHNPPVEKKLSHLLILFERWTVWAFASNYLDEFIWLQLEEESSQLPSLKHSASF